MGDTPISLMATQHEALSCLHTLQENFSMQGANGLLNDMFNIVRQQNLHTFK